MKKTHRKITFRRETLSIIDHPGIGGGIEPVKPQPYSDWCTVACTFSCGCSLGSCN